MNYGLFRSIASVLSVFVLFFSTSHAFPDTVQTDWQLLESARMSFEKNEFGDALLFCNKARTAHEKDYSYRLSVLKRALSSVEVKNAGDDISSVYAILQKRSELAALAVLDEIFLNKSKESFGKSLLKLLEWLSSKLVYPECDFLVGEIYEAEGEYALAEKWYLDAWKNAAFLDIPDEKYTILYRLADLSKNSGNSKMQIEYLLMILADDVIFDKNGNESGLLTAMKRTVSVPENGISRLFVMYRHKGYVFMSAYASLARLYLAPPDLNTDLALSAGLAAAITAVTRLEDSVSRFDIHYTYVNLEQLIVLATQNSQILQAAEKAGVWDSLFIAAEALSASGLSRQASELFILLSKYCPISDIAKRSRYRLTSLNTN